MQSGSAMRIVEWVWIEGDFFILAHREIGNKTVACWCRSAVGHDTPEDQFLWGHTPRLMSRCDGPETLSITGDAARRESHCFRSFFHPHSSQRDPFACENDKNAAGSAECKW